MLKNLLSVTLKEQGSYTQYVGIKSFKLQRENFALCHAHVVEYKQQVFTFQIHSMCSGTSVAATKRKDQEKNIFQKFTPKTIKFFP